MFKISENTFTVDGQNVCFGSQDLIRLAGYASDGGFYTKGFFIADDTLDSLDAEENTRVSDEMLTIFDEWGADELDVSMNDDFSNLYVIGVELVSILSEEPIFVGREGKVQTLAYDETLVLLRNAFKVLQLS